MACKENKRTKNLSLSQFEADDKPSWLTDYNNDMDKLDDAMTKTAYDPPIKGQASGPVEQAGGIASFLTNGLESVSGGAWTTGAFPNPLPNVFTNYSVQYCYHPGLQVLFINGAITCNTDAYGTDDKPILKLTSVPTLPLPNNDKMMVSAGYVGSNSGDLSAFNANLNSNGNLVLAFAKGNRTLIGLNMVFITNTWSVQ